MKIIFDNCSDNKDIKKLWGFSAYFSKYNLLFDTGSNGRVLLENMKKLDVEVKDIKYIFISHSHWDHIGGLDSILELNPNVTLFVPSSLSKHLINDLKTLAKEVVIISKEPQQLYSNLYSTGILGTQMPEQSLVINEKDEATLITGCGHYGIEHILKSANQIIDKKITTVIGGFHLLNSDETKILETIEELKKQGVKKSFATHCSGKKAIEIFRENFNPI